MNHQKGMSFVGMLFTMASVIFLGYIVMRILPVYLEHYAVMHAVSSMASLPATEFSPDQARNAEILRSKLINQFDIDNVTIPPEQIKISPKNQNVLVVSISYRVVKPLFYNISLMVDFNDSQEVHVGAE